MHRRSPYRNAALAGFIRPALLALAVGSLLSGSLRAQTVLYWDTNGATAGAGGPSPSGPWSDNNGSKNRNWNTTADGSTTWPTSWVAGATAHFSAGTDATGAYSVTVSGTQQVADIYVDQGSPTISGGTLNFVNPSATFAVASGSVATVSASLTGAGTALNKTGAGTLVLAGSDTYAGATNINAGTLQLGAGNVLPGTAVTVAAGANFNLNNYSTTVGSLAGAGQLTLGGGTLTVGTDNTSTTFAGSFAGGDTGTFAKTGSGTLTLGADVSLSGGNLTLSGGTLALGGFDSSFSSLTVTSNSILDFGGASTLSLASLTINPGATLTVTNWSDAADYFYSLADPGATTLGRIVFSGYTPSGAQWQSWDRQITPVPEPSAYGAASVVLSSLLAGLLRQRRKVRSGLN